MDTTENIPVRDMGAEFAAPAEAALLLDVRNLKVHLRTSDAVVRAVDGVDFQVAPGECVGIVGESGSGKSTLARAVSRLMAQVQFAELSGTADFNGADTLTMSTQALRNLRRKSGFSMIFQDPLGYLNPTMRVGRQIREALSPGHYAMPELERIHALLREVGLRDVEHVARRFPHELSGGMRQRIMIAMALASEARCCCSPTSPPLRWTPPSSYRCWRRCTGCTWSAAWPWSSLPTTWAWSPRSAIVSTSCAAEKWWSRPTPLNCSTRLDILTRRA